MGKRAPVVRPTGRFFWSDPCPFCEGSGRTRCRGRAAGWYVDYHFQDGHELCGPYGMTEAARLVADHRDGTSTVTLIAPDGEIHELSRRR